MLPTLQSTFNNITFKKTKQNWLFRQNTILFDIPVADIELHMSVYVYRRMKVENVSLPPLQLLITV